MTARIAGFSIPAERDLVDHGPQLGRVAAGPAAVDDRVGRPQDAEQRPAAAAVLGRAADEPGDLDELDEHAADPGQGGDGTQRRERVVAGLDLDLGERLQDRRLADVRRADERDLGRALAPNGDRIAMDGARADPRVLDLREQRLAQVRVRTVPIIGQLASRSARTSRIRSRPSFPTSRRFATCAKVRCGIGMTISSGLAGRGDGAARRRPIRRRSAAGVRRSPLPPTLVTEGAAQPFRLEIWDEPGVLGTPADPDGGHGAKKGTRPTRGADHGRSSMMRVCPSGS